MLNRSIALILVPLFSFLSPLVCQEEEKILGVGAATIDLLIPVDDHFLANQCAIKKGGSTPSTPESIERVLSASHASAKIVPGGSAANTNASSVFSLF